MRGVGRLLLGLRAWSVGGRAVPVGQVLGGLERHGLRVGGAGALLAGACGLGWQVSLSEAADDEEDDGRTEIVNWSGTHKITTEKFVQPQTIDELEQILADAHKRGEKLRVVGSCLSPNGLAMSEQGMVSMALCDRIISVDPDSKRITVEAGATVAQVIDALRPHGLTLQNLASINEQQLGGFIQVSAHGTGASIPPVDQQVVAMDLVTPAEGVVHLSSDENGDLFDMCKVGLGALGVVARVTLQCVDAHLLQEHTFVQTVSETRARHADLLREHRHVRYMWLPYTDSVVVVTCDPAPPGSKVGITEANTTEATSLEPLQQMLKDTQPGCSVDGLNFAALRDRIISANPLDLEHIKRLNRAEAHFWKNSAGCRIAKSEDCLAFECGGSQCVWEVCFPCGSQSQPSSVDLDFVTELLQRIEQDQIPAPSPIEQRWTAPSTAPMSPASATDRNALFSWVGIIMYLPTDDEAQRTSIMNRFHQYSGMLGEQLPKYNGHTHWAKLEPPTDKRDLVALRSRLSQKYPAHRFVELRQRFDPRNVLANKFVDQCFPLAS